MKKDLISRLKNYALGAAAFTATGNIAEAQMLYTDVNPDDTISGNGSTYELDLNNDGVIDFNFSILEVASSGSSSGFIFNFQAAGILLSAASSNEFLGDSSAYPYALSSGDSIKAAQGWTNTSYGALFSESNYFSSVNGQTFMSSSSGGNWQNATEKYLGLRIELNGNTHYGWARLSVLSATEFVIHDYAIQLTPNTPVAAGDTGTTATIVTADAVVNVVGSDITDNGNGLDLNFKFNKIADETTILNYRVFAVKDTTAASFDLAAAMAVVTGNYTDVAKTGSNIDAEFGATSKDTDGDLIEENVPYRLFVMSIADGVNAQNNNLSAPSNEVTLEDVTGISGVIGNGQYTIAQLAEGVRISSVNNPMISAELFNLNGQRVAIFNNQNEILVENAKFSSGIYFLRVDEGGSTKSFKLLIP